MEEIATALVYNDNMYVFMRRGDIYRMITDDPSGMYKAERLFSFYEVVGSIQRPSSDVDTTLPEPIVKAPVAPEITP
jgi:hypothetical protein